MIDRGLLWRQILGWSAVAVSTGLACMWAWWGSIENFHEGWYSTDCLAEYRPDVGAISEPDADRDAGERGSFSLAAVGIATDGNLSDCRGLVFRKISYFLRRCLAHRDSAGAPWPALPLRSSPTAQVGVEMFGRTAARDGDRERRVSRVACDAPLRRRRLWHAADCRQWRDAGLGARGTGLARERCLLVSSNAMLRTSDCGWTSTCRLTAEYLATADCG